MNNRRDFLKNVALFGAAAATLPAYGALSHSALAQNIAQPRPIDREGLFAMAYHTEVLRGKMPPRQINIPDVSAANGEQYKVLKGDFHIHTLFSDGTVTPAARVIEAVDNGFDVISITDHIENRIFITAGDWRLAENNDCHNHGYNFARAAAEANDLILVRGTEITKPVWHFNTIFIEDANPMVAVVDDWRQMIAVAADQGAFIFWNHPHPHWINRTPAPYPGGQRFSLEPMRFFDEIEEHRERGQLHGVEVFNGYDHSSVYPVALDWCNERNLAPMAVSDIHLSEWEAYGRQNPQRPVQLILAKERTHDSVKEAFFARRLVGWAANMIFGNETWVRQLFNACVKIETIGNRSTLRNNSDIPCLIDIGNQRVVELLAQGTLTINHATPTPRFTVKNWFVGMNKPLEVGG